MGRRITGLVMAIAVLGSGVSFAAEKPASPAEQEFCRLDKNNDREITMEEFAACEFYKLEHVRALPFADAKDLKMDRSGNISDDDLKAYLFNKADRNRNGKIDRREWEEFYESLQDPGGGISHGRMDRR